MKKTMILVALALMTANAINAQTANGGISDDMLKEIQKGGALTVADRALSNAIAANAIDDLAKNRKNARRFTTTTLAPAGVEN